MTIKEERILVDMLINRENIEEVANAFYDQAFEANAYFALIKQYSVNYEKYAEIMGISSAFYTISYNALVQATVMTLAKIYDSHRDSINMEKFLKSCAEHLDWFPKGIEFNLVTHKSRQINYDDSCVISEQVVYKDYCLEEEFGRLQKEYEDLLGSKEFLRKQRNKIYAHMDLKTIHNIKEVQKKNPINFANIENMISFSLKFSQMILALLTGVNKATEYINIMDWEGTLRLAKVGTKYKGYNIEEIDGMRCINED